ncbi:hypothetical protein MATL_G00144330 [Megalops atlanticus]|uniref:Polycystic kidney disease protein 1-like 2 n=1 Tax=Megalops atlanticus TaxID=7932 RepID=A0A9D3PWC1_MEGAT|nr:hypothetical protein MATL_G00144330 [Megalops atlanticus]
MAFPNLFCLSVLFWIPGTVLSEANVSCAEGMVQFRNACYEFVQEPRSWSEADRYCRGRGGKLMQALNCKIKTFLEENVTHPRNQSWWVGQGLLGEYKVSQKPASNFSQLGGSSESTMGNGNQTLFCTYIIMDPSFQLLTTPACELKHLSICRYDPIGTNMTEELDSLEEEADVSGKVNARSKRSTDQGQFQLDASSALANATTQLQDTEYTVQMAVDLLDKVEQGRIQFTFEQKMTYLQGLLNTTLMCKPESVKSKAETFSLIFQCAGAILVYSISQCDQENLYKMQYQAMSALVLKIYEAISFLISQSVDGTIIQNSVATIYTSKRTPRQLAHEVIGDPENGSHIVMPSFSALESYLGQYSTINVQMYNFKVNPFREESDENITGSVCGLVLKDEKAEEVHLYKLSETIQIFLPRPDAPAPSYKNMSITESTAVTTAFNVSDVQHTVVVVMEPSENVSLQLLLARGFPPSGTQHHHSTVLNRSDAASDSAAYRWLVTPDMLSLGNGTWYLQARLLNYSGQEEGLTLRVTTFATKCLFWDDGRKDWSTSGCWVGPLSEPQLTQCLCNHLTFFGSSFFIMPNHVDLTRIAEYFSTVTENYVVVALLTVFFGLYLVMLIWACYTDKQALRKKKLTLLADNHPCAQYNYLLNVQTGHRRGAGTSAQVEVTLQGSEGESGSRYLTDPDKPVFERGGVDMFLLATPFSLGDLQSIRVLHDDSGGHPSWYLYKMTIQDLQTRKLWHFLCSTWLSSVKGDGMTKRTFHPAKRNEITSFRNIFQSRTSSGFRDEHIWVSVLDPPRRSPFTRAQRVSCCMCLLLCTMAINIMFWNKPQDQQSPVIFNIGSMKVTWEDIMIGVESGLLMFPINILIITIFRSIRPRPLPPAQKHDHAQGRRRLPSPWRPSSRSRAETEELVTILSKNQKNKVPPLEKKLESFSDLCTALDCVHRLLQLMQGEGDGDAHWVHCSQFVLYCLHHLADTVGRVDVSEFPSQEDRQQAQNTMALLVKKAEMVSSIHTPHSPASIPEKGRSSGCWLPWWFVFVGWFLLLSISGVSTFFTLLYGFVYGKESSIQWVISLGLSLFQSIFILQPLKVVGVAIFFALILKTVAVEESEEVEWLLEEQRERCESYCRRVTP